MPSMTDEARQLIIDHCKEFPSRANWDGFNLRPHYCPTAREAYALLGKELPKDFIDHQKGDKTNETK